MPHFNYSALHENGDRTEGTLEARNRSDALEVLSRKNLRPTKLIEASGGVTPESTTGAVSVAGKTRQMEKGESKPSRPDPVINATGNVYLSRRNLIDFTEELGELLGAGMALDPALKVLEQRRDRSGVKAAAARIRQQIRDGTSLSAALKRTSTSFGDLYCNLVSAGEASGALPSILIRQHAFLVMMQEIRSKTIGALVYPAVITVCGLALLFIVSFLLGPQLESMLSTMGKAQPLPTRLLLTGSRFLTTWWWAILLVASLSIMAFLRAIRTGSGRDLWHRWQLHIPVFGPVLAAQFHATLCHTLATLISSGIPLMNALRLVTHATANQHIRASLERASLMVAEGVSLSKALEKNGSFPSVLLDYISLGEQTGDLASALAKAGARYDNELSRNVAFLTSLIQPVIIICMALMVGLVAYAIISGIFSAVSGLKLRG